MSAAEFSHPSEFVNRHCGLSAEDERAMLRAIGMETLDDLAKILPPEIVGEAPDICATLSEDEAAALLWKMARNNTAAVSMLGLGYYGTSMPAVVRRNL
ncbi:MAG: glycine dehydrogenase (aminomethyl-transferring), partial [Betaproteobacteria bacterium]|nr:glycine dehydrogenase (aminomethyl-transferring) [Betaproteobacteria bacterium]